MMRTPLCMTRLSMSSRESISTRWRLAVLSSPGTIEADDGKVSSGKAGKDTNTSEGSPAGLSTMSMLRIWEPSAALFDALSDWIGRFADVVGVPANGFLTVLRRGLRFSYCSQRSPVCWQFEHDTPSALLHLTFRAWQRRQAPFGDAVVLLRSIALADPRGSRRRGVSIFRHNQHNEHHNDAAER